MRSVFFSTAALLCAATSVFASPVTQKRAVPNNVNGADLDTIILNYALTLEHLENAFYSQGLANYTAQDFAKAGFPSGVYQRFTEIAQDEATHVSLLSTALGANATQACTYNFSSVTDAKSFAALSSVLEGVGVSAYAGAAGNITNAAYLSVAASILTVEARHASWVTGAVNNGSAFPNAFDTPISSFSTIYTLAAQFISSCPSSNPSLPVTQFPSLAVTPASATGGDLITLNFNATATNGSVVYAAFYNGLAPTFVQVNENNTVTVPSGIKGQTYVVLSRSNTQLTDADAVAGVAILNGA